MARPRTPKAKAYITGRSLHDKARFQNRSEPIVDGELGAPPTWLRDTEKNKPRLAWEIIRDEIPWLNSSHRMLVATMCNQLGRLVAGQDIGVQASVFIRQCLGQMGATPADASKIPLPQDDPEDDPAFKYFN